MLNANHERIYSFTCITSETSARYLDFWWSLNLRQHFLGNYEKKYKYFKISLRARDTKKLSGLFRYHRLQFYNSGYKFQILSPGILSTIAHPQGFLRDSVSLQALTEKMEHLANCSRKVESSFPKTMADIWTCVIQWQFWLHYDTEYQINGRADGPNWICSGQRACQFNLLLSPFTWLVRRGA